MTACLPLFHVLKTFKKRTLWFTRGGSCLIVVPVMIWKQKEAEEDECREGMNKKRKRDRQRPSYRLRRDINWMSVLFSDNRGHCELSCYPPQPLLSLWTSPDTWLAVCQTRRFRQRGLISINGRVNTLITHLSNEAAVSQPFSHAWIMVCVCVWQGTWELSAVWTEGMLCCTQKEIVEKGLKKDIKTEWMKVQEWLFARNRL